MTRDVDAIRADLAARTVGGMASSPEDRDIAALLGVIDGLRSGIAAPWSDDDPPGADCHHDLWIFCQGRPNEHRKCIRCGWLDRTWNP